MARVALALAAGAAGLAVLVVGAGAIAPEPPVAPRLTLRFVTFNVLHGGIFSELTGHDEGLDARLRMTVDGLRALDADVVGLQEASAGRRRGDVAARLAAALGYQHVRAPAAYRPFGSERMRRGVRAVLGFVEGPAILSRLPIRLWQAWELPPCGRPFDVRVLLMAELETPAGPLAAFSAHTAGDVCHTRAVAQLVRRAAGAHPAIVMGDFNAEATSPAMRLLTEEVGWVDAFRAVNPEAPGPTDGQDVTAGRPTARQRIDYVLLAAGARDPARIAASRIVLDEPRADGPVRWPSDHYGVLADVVLDAPAGSWVARDSAAPDEGG